MNSRKRAAKFESSDVMRYLFAGWFSATAEEHFSAKSPCGKREAVFAPRSLEWAHLINTLL
jgi:hypothetical protein